MGKELNEIVMKTYNTNGIQKILIIMLYRIGDVLLTTPVVSEIKRLIPGAIVHFLVEKSFFDIVSLNPQIDEILLLEKKLIPQLKLIFRLRKEKYNFIFDFQSNPRSALLTLLSGAEKTFGYDFNIRRYFYKYAYRPNARPQYAVDFKFNLLRSAGFNPEKHSTFFYFSKDDGLTAEKILNQLNIKEKKFFILSTTSRRKTRRWLPEYFVKLACMVYKDTGIPLLLVAGPGEREYVQRIYDKCKECFRLLPPLTIKQAGALFRSAKMYIGNDNGLKHLSVAVGLPTFTIFGPSQPSYWTPPDAIHRWIRTDVDCIECGRVECDNIKCMKLLAPERVFEELLSFIRELDNITNVVK